MTTPPPGLDHTLTTLRRSLTAGTALLVAVSVVVSAIVAAHPWGATAVGAGAAVLLALSTWWTTSRAVVGGDALVGWVAGGYLLKAAIVLGSLVASRAWDLGPRWTGLWVIVAVLVCAGSEVAVLSRARIATVDPFPSGRDSGP